MKWFRHIVLSFGVSTAMLLSTEALAEDAFDRALALASQERYSESREVLEPLLGQETSSPRARLLHGILRVHEGKKGDAAAVFVRLTREYPDLFEAYNNLAVLYAEDGRLDEARETLLAILERRQEAVGFRNLGDIYVHLARQAYTRSRELDTGIEANGKRNPDLGRISGHVEASAAPAAAATAEARTRKTDGDSAKANSAKAPGVASISSATAAMAEAHARKIDDEPAEEPGTMSIVTTVLHNTCTVVSEFKDPGAADEARQWLQSRGDEIMDLRREKREFAEDYRVYMPPFASRKSATDVMQMLRNAGVSDVSVILRGPLKNGVSLGVYKEKKNVAERVASLEKRGISVLTMDNTKTVEEYTVIEARVGGTYDLLDTAWATRFPKHPIQRVDCV